MGIAALVGPAERGLRTEEISPVLQQLTELRRAMGIPTLISVAVRVLRTGQVTRPLQQHTEVKCAVGIPTLIGAAKRGLRTAEISPAFQQHTEVERPVGIPALIGAAVRVLRARQVTRPLQQHTEIRGGFGRLLELLLSTSDALIDQLVSRLRRHLEGGHTDNGIALRSVSVHQLRSGHPAIDLSRHRLGGIIRRRPRLRHPEPGVRRSSSPLRRLRNHVPVPTATNVNATRNTSKPVDGEPPGRAAGRDTGFGRDEGFGRDTGFGRDEGFGRDPASAQRWRASAARGVPVGCRTCQARRMSAGRRSRRPANRGRPGSDVTAAR